VQVRLAQQQARQRVQEQQLAQQQVPQQRGQRQRVLEQQVQRLLLFCRKRTKQQQR
jgi:hypothetical protein